MKVIKRILKAVLVSTAFVPILFCLFAGLVFAAYIGSDLDMDVDRDGTQDIHLVYDGTYMALLFGSEDDPTSASARGIRYSTGDLEYNDSGSWADIGSGGGSETKAIVLDWRGAIGETNLDKVWFVQERDGARISASRANQSGDANVSSDLYLPFRLPEDFDSWYDGGANVSIDVYRDGTVDTMTLTICDSNEDADDGVNAADIEPSSDTTWETKTDTLTETDYTAGEWCYAKLSCQLDDAIEVNAARFYLKYDTAE